MGQDFSTISEEIVKISRLFYRQGWVLGTSGNFSAVLSRNPLRLAITASGKHKDKLTRTDILEVGPEAEICGEAKVEPSAETLLHIEVVRRRRAGAVLHTHSNWSTVLSEVFAGDRGLSFQGYEMLKGLEGVTTHEHREWLPILENSQDTRALSKLVGEGLDQHSDSHGFLLRRHGLYTWGKDLEEAQRHVEILEFLLEAMGRERLVGG